MNFSFSIWELDNIPTSKIINYTLIIKTMVLVIMIILIVLLLMIIMIMIATVMKYIDILLKNKINILYFQTTC